MPTLRISEVLLFSSQHINLLELQKNQAISFSLTAQYLRKFAVWYIASLILHIMIDLVYSLCCFQIRTIIS